MSVSIMNAFDTCDVGDVVVFERESYKGRGYIPERIAREVLMTIKAPRGRLVILQPSDPYGSALATDSMAVRAFMEQHLDD